MVDRKQSLKSMASVISTSAISASAISAKSRDEGAFVSLALANKLRLIFEREDDDKFLTYPLACVNSFDYRYLSFMDDPSTCDLTLNEMKDCMGDFARLMNFIPEDSARYNPDTRRYLWHEVENVLNNADYAVGALSDTEARQLDEAIAFLRDMYVDQEDGSKTPVDTVAVQMYEQYEDNYYAALEVFYNEEIAVKTTCDDEGELLKLQWQEYREKQLRGVIENALQAWVTKGYKYEVENCREIVLRLEPRKYMNRKGDKYLDELRRYENSDSKSYDFYDTFFSPIDAFDKDNKHWRKLTLTKKEMNTLAREAPAYLKSIFSQAAEASYTIEEVSLEYNNVFVERPWFNPGFFPGFIESRYWRDRDGRDVSDGETPRGGLIPAYISSILAVRNILITRKKTAQVAQPVAMPIFGADNLAQLRKHTRTRQLAQAAQSAEVAKTPLRKDIKQDRRNRFKAVKRVGMAAKAPQLIIPPRKPMPLPHLPDELVTETYDLDGVVVMAYICERLPKSPNPDETLIWGV